MDCVMISMKREQAEESQVQASHGSEFIIIVGLIEYHCT